MSKAAQFRDSGALGHIPREPSYDEVYWRIVTGLVGASSRASSLQRMGLNAPMQWIFNGVGLDFAWSGAGFSLEWYWIFTGMALDFPWSGTGFSLEWQISLEWRTFRWNRAGFSVEWHVICTGVACDFRWSGAGFSLALDFRWVLSGSQRATIHFGGCGNLIG